MAGGTINLAVKTTNDNSGLKAAGADLDNFGKSAAAAGGNMDAFDKKAAAASANLEKNMVRASAVATLGIAALGGLAIKTAADFERSMDQVGAVAGATASEMDQLSGAAKKIGADTAFSASQAAGAMEELAQGGRTVAQILGGEARAAVDLAAASGMDLAASGRAMATTMDIYKNSQLDVNDVVNRFSGVANASRFSADDMVAAMAQAGGVAADLGVDFNELTTVVALTASSFASGSDAGTSFKTFLLGLDGTSDKAKQAISDLGLEFRTATGELKGMDEIALELEAKVGSLGEAQRVAALKTIFGNDAYRTAAALMDGAGEAYEKVDGILANTNASDIAEQRMSNLAGSFEAFKGSAETLAISLGEKALPALTNIADAGVAAVNGFAGLPESTQTLALTMVGLASAAPLAAAGVKKVAETVSTIKTSGPSAGMAMSGIALGIGAAAVAVDLLVTKLSGHSLMEWIVGDPGAADAAKGFVKDIEDVATAAAATGKPIDGATAALQAWNHEVEEGRMSATNYFGKFSNTKGWDENKAKIQELAEAMKSGGATAEQYKEVHDSLGYLGKATELQELFDKHVNYQGILTAEMALVQESAAADLEGINALKEQGRALDAVAEAAPPATSALQDFVAGLGEGKTLAEELGGQLDILAGRFGSLDPQMAINNINLAILKEELADVTRAGGEYSDRLGLTVDQMKDAIAGYEDQNAALGENEQAYRDVMGAMESLAGSAGILSGAVLNIDDAIQGANLSADAQIEIAGQVGQAFGELATADIPGFIGALLTIGETSPEVMKTVVDSITDPAQKAAILDHLRGMGSEADTILTEGFGEASNSAVQALNDGLAAGQPLAEEAGGQLGFAAVTGLEAMDGEVYSSGMSLGQSAADGMSAGIYSKAAAVAQAAWDMVAGAIGAANAAQDSRSPSKEYEKLGRYAGDGYVDGLRASEPFVQDASAQMVEAGIDAAAGATDEYGILLGNITPFDRHGRTTTAENGNPMGWVLGTNGAWKWVEIDPDAEPDPEKPIVYGGADPNAPPPIDVVHPPPPPPPPRETTPPPPGPPNHPSTPGPGGTMQPGDTTRTAGGKVYWDGTGEEPSEPWVGYGAFLGQSGPGKSQLYPLVPMPGGKIAWDPNINDYVPIGPQEIAPDSNVGWSPETGYVTLNPVEANYGLTVYQDSNGAWRDVVTGELATGPDGKFLNSQYQQDAVAWISRLQNDQAKFGQKGLQAAVAKPTAWQSFWSGAGMTPNSMSNDPHRMNNFEWFTTKADWAAKGYGEDSEWTSDPWFGDVPVEWLKTPEGKAYLAMRGIDPENNPATRNDYNPWHPNAMAGGGTRVHSRDGSYRTVGRRTQDVSSEPKSVNVYVSAMDTQDFIRNAAKIREALRLDDKAMVG